MNSFFNRTLIIITPRTEIKRITNWINAHIQLTVRPALIISIELQMKRNAWEAEGLRRSVDVIESIIRNHEL